MADDQGYGDAGFTGHPSLQTPSMDDMAAGGLVFDRFYAAAPICSPTRASIMTGRHPFRTNVLSHGHYMRPAEVTLAEVLKQAGYRTAHFGKWHIGSVQPDTPTNPGGAGFDYWLSGLNFFDQDPFLSRNGVYEQIMGQGTAITMDATLQFIEAHKDSREPLFITTWFPSPHVPHTEKPTARGTASVSGENRGYYDEIQLLDEQLGRLRASLRQWGMAENTVLWYCSDNGGLVNATSGGRGKKGVLYEGGLRVPSILEWPGHLIAKHTPVPATTADIYPTLLTLAGCEIPASPTLDGVSLLSSHGALRTNRPPIGFWHGIERGQTTRSDAIIEALMRAQRAGGPNPFPERRLKNVEDFPNRKRQALGGHGAWIDWPWKLHRKQKGDTISFELYHLGHDGEEQDDLAKRWPERVQAMASQLERWQAAVCRSLEGADYSGD